MVERVNHKPVLIMTFEGVIYDYDKYGWDGIEELPGKPLEGSKEAVDELSEKYDIYVYSDRLTQKRGREAVQEWLDYYDFEIKDLIFQPIPHFVFIGPKMKKFPRKWKDEFIRELKDISPKG